MGHTERVTLTGVHCRVWNGELVGSCCIAQGAQPGAL